MHDPEASPFQALRRLMEDEWTPQMMETLGIDEPSLPVIWDADFLYGARDAHGADTYVLCEINASSCFGIPDEAPAAIARSQVSSGVGPTRESNPVVATKNAPDVRRCDHLTTEGGQDVETNG